MTRRRLPVVTAIVIAALAAGIALVACHAQPVAAASLRCPGATIGSGGLMTASEVVILQQLWTDVGEGDGSSGPLGCPVGDPGLVPGPPWQGYAQKFQRGWILIETPAAGTSEVVAIAGVNGWTIWWLGLPTNAIVASARPSRAEPPEPAANAAWDHGGVYQTTTETKPVALWACVRAPCYRPPDPKGGPGVNRWMQLTPWLDPGTSTFDFASRLDATQLASPDSGSMAKRIDAAFPSWLPCYTVVPLSGPAAGEDQVARATVSARRVTPCPISGRTPRSDVLAWLADLALPSDQKPGTTSDTSPCTRSGDLDVTLAQLLHLISKYRSFIPAGTMSHLRDVLKPWGGPAREDPYVSPDGSCLGYAVIESENHLLLQESDKYLINALLAGQNLGSDYDNSTNRTWILRFLQQIVRGDFYEYNALPYGRYQLKALLLLHDYSGDASIQAASEGVLDWIFAKESVSANMDRDHRPFRRRPEPDRYARSEWWLGTGPTSASVAELALLVGPVQHVHEDIDLQLDNGRDPDGDPALTSLIKYPELATAPVGFLTEFTDIADTTYRPPSAISSWLVQRFANDAANRVTYVQAIHHTSPIADDPALWAQANGGTELVSGNRNWTMVAGGTPVAPGDPGPPPQGAVSAAGFALGGAAAGAGLGALAGSVAGPVGAAVGAVVGGLAGLFGGIIAPDVIAANKQHDQLWADQPGIMRETTLIPSAVGLDRSQTIRFGLPHVTRENDTAQPRLCVAEGFMCGFDLQMPTHPFPAKDASQCPLHLTLPTVLQADFDAPVAAAPGAPLLAIALGCLVEAAGTVHDWQIWKFENGQLAIHVGDPPGAERVVEAWVEPRNPGRALRVRWRTPGSSHDWFNVHVYNTSVDHPSGDNPDGWILQSTVGDADNTDTWDHGDAEFSLDGVTDSTWELLIEGCDPTYGLFGIRTGHECHGGDFPAVSVSVAPRPIQPFSCDATQDAETGAVVMEVGGSCSSSPYGLFVYVWSRPCGFDQECPNDATSFGFVIAAPSRGWQLTDFEDVVRASVAPNESGYRAASTFPVTVAVPVSPPVIEIAPGFWRATGPETSHVVSFRWNLPNATAAAIVGDTGAGTAYATLAADIGTWPTALGHVSVPDLPASLGAGVIGSSGNGCFTVAGLATRGQSDPRGLVVDLRQYASPKIGEPPSSQLDAAC